MTAETRSTGSNDSNNHELSVRSDLMVARFGCHPDWYRNQFYRFMGQNGVTHLVNGRSSLLEEKKFMMTGGYQKLTLCCPNPRQLDRQDRPVVCPTLGFDYERCLENHVRNTPYKVNVYGDFDPEAEGGAFYNQQVRLSLENHSCLSLEQSWIDGDLNPKITTRFVYNTGKKQSLWRRLPTTLVGEISHLNKHTLTTYPDREVFGAKLAEEIETRMGLTWKIHEDGMVRVTVDRGSDEIEACLLPPQGLDSFLRE